MEPADLSAGDLLKRAGNHCFSQNLTERGSIVNILRPFLCAKDRDFLRKMRGRKQGVALFISRNRASEVRILFGVERMASAIAAVNLRTLGKHIDGVVVQKLQLRGKLNDIVPRTGSRRQQLAAALPETIQTCLCG